MAVMKCKMCGGDLVLTPGSTVAECEYCGTLQTVPSADNEKKLNLFTRANRLRAACDFDKAAGVYEAIVADFPEEAEGYWGLVLSKYGIEYVDDPATGKKIPTCHRSSFDSVMDDPNYDLTLENADVIARKVYREEAKVIEEIRKGIIEVSSKEDPYDVFICYKETDAEGGRTLDSVLAQDIYTTLTEKGYRVFFSRITLEDKLGQEYEPYIFAALNSAKVMLAVGTDYEHYNAVWVKNEWSRYLKLMAAGQKKTLIPCYKNIDAYDMPKEFAKLQAQDLGKVGAMQDLVRGIDKLLGAGAQAAPAASGVKEDDLNKSFIYNNALERAAENKIPAVKDAIKKMKTISGWRDADSRVLELEAQLKKLKKKRLIKRLVILTIIAAIVGGAAMFVLGQINEQKKGYYNKGVSYMESGDYERAISQFKKADGYEDAEAQYQKASELYERQEAALGPIIDAAHSDGSGAFGHMGGAWEAAFLVVDSSNSYWEYIQELMPITDLDDPSQYGDPKEMISGVQGQASVIIGEDGSLKIKDQDGVMYQVSLDQATNVLTLKGEGVLKGEYCPMNQLLLGYEESITKLDEMGVLARDVKTEDGKELVIEPYDLYNGGSIYFQGEELLSQRCVVRGQDNELRFGFDQSWILVVRMNMEMGCLEVSTIGEAPYDMAGTYYAQ